MKTFQKLQLLSSIIVPISPIFVAICTCICCYKTKKYYLRYSITTIAYIVIWSSLSGWLGTFNIVWLPWIGCLPITFVFNYLCVKLQMDCVA